MSGWVDGSALRRSHQQLALWAFIEHTSNITRAACLSPRCGRVMVTMRGLSMVLITVRFDCAAERLKLSFCDLSSVIWLLVYTCMQSMGPPPLLFSFFSLFSLSLKAFRVFCRVHCFIGKALIVLFNVTNESEGSFIPQRSLSLHVLSVSQLLFFQIPGVLLVLFSFASSHELLLTAH